MLSIYTECRVVRLQVLRLMCIQCLCNNGFKPKLLEYYKKEIIQVCASLADPPACIVLNLHANHLTIQNSNPTHSPCPPTPSRSSIVWWKLLFHCCHGNMFPWKHEGCSFSRSKHATMPNKLCFKMTDSVHYILPLTYYGILECS